MDILGIPVELILVGIGIGLILSIVAYLQYISRAKSYTIHIGRNTVYLKKVQERGNTLRFKFFKRKKVIAKLHEPKIMQKLPPRRVFFTLEGSGCTINPEAWATKLKIRKDELKKWMTDKALSTRTDKDGNPLPLSMDERRLLEKTIDETDLHEELKPGDTKDVPMVEIHDEFLGMISDDGVLGNLRMLGGLPLAQLLIYAFGFVMLGIILGKFLIPG